MQAEQTATVDQVDILSQPSQSQRVTPHQAGSAVPQATDCTHTHGQAGQGAAGLAGPRNRPAAGQQQAVTPELVPVQSCAEVLHQAAMGQPPELGTAKPLAALFRPKTARKVAPGGRRVPGM